MSGSLLYRTESVASKDVDLDARTATFSWASSTPVRRWFGNEILDIKPSSIRAERLTAGLVPFLLGHKTDDQIGVVEKHWHSGGKVYGTAKFSKSQRAQEILEDMSQGVRRGISVGYKTFKMKKVRTANPTDPDDVDDFLVTDFEPLEISSVSVAADPRVGIGRADGNYDLRGVEITDKDGEPLC